MSGRPNRRKGRTGAPRNGRWERRGSDSRQSRYRQATSGDHATRHIDHRHGSDGRGSPSASTDAPREERSGNPEPTVHPEAAHMLTGETRFSSAMSYMSEGHRSDVATVGSGSVMEDVEVESIHSPDDGGRASPPGPWGQLIGPEVHSLSPGETLATSLLSHQSPASRLDLKGVSQMANQSHEKGQDLKSQLKDTSNDVHEKNDSDEANSLGVEAHSVGERSVQSLEGIPETDEATNWRSEVTSTKAAATDEVNPLHSTGVEGGGRRSPGGTIYKGRGTRRYQGRYMHLPLKRFHEGTSTHLSEMLPLARFAAAPQHSQSIPGYDPRASPGRCDERTSHRERSRSRSRSPGDKEEDRKPAARRR